MVRSYQNTNSEMINFYLDRMNQNKLTIEDILKEEDVVNDLKKNSSSQFFSIFSNEIIRKLIDYSTKMPVSNDIDRGYKYPFFSCEILSSDSETVLDFFFQNSKFEIENSEDDSDESQEDSEDEKNDEVENEDKQKKQDEKIKEDDPSIEKTIKEGDEKGNLENKEEDKAINEESKVKEDVKAEQTEEKHNTVESQKENGEIEDKSKQIETITKEVNSLSIEDQKETAANNDKEQENIKTEIESEDKQLKKPKKESREKKYKIVYCNLDYFFQFLEIPTEQTNHVLIGYFYKILCSLIDKKGDVLINYLFEHRPDLLDYFVNHLNRRLIGECVGRILTYSNENNDTTFNENKLIFLEKIIQGLQETKDEDSFEYICFSLVTSLANKQFFQLLMSNEKILDLLFSILYRAMYNERNLYFLLHLMIKINETILKGFNGLVTPDRSNEGFSENINANFLYLQMNFDEDKRSACIFGDNEEDNEKNLKVCLDYLFKSLKEGNFIFLQDLNKFDKPDMEVTTYEGEQKVLGMKKLIQVEYFRTILDIMINSYSKKYFISEIEDLINISIEANIFGYLIDIFYKFEFNNMFQIIFWQILTIVLNENCPIALIDHIFTDNKFIDKIQNHLITNSIFSFASERTINSCLFAFEVKFFSEIINSPNKCLQQFIENSEFKIFNEIYISDINGIFKGKLCYIEEGSNYTYNQFSSQSNVPQPKCMNKSLDEIIHSNMEIFEVYKQKGDYKALLEEKLKNGELLRNQNKNINEEFNISDDGNIFDERNKDDREDTENRGEFEVFDNRNYEQKLIDGESAENAPQKNNFNDYSDNNYWKSTNEETNKKFDDLIEELLR